MLYALYQNDTFVRFTEESPFTGTPKLKDIVVDGQSVQYNRVEDHWDWEKKSAEEMHFLATKATEQFGRLWIATVRGKERGLIEVPAVGDEVSYAFNGDYTPCGTITKVSPKYHVTTSTGHKFREKGESGAWVMEGGTWSLVRGHIEERNPHV